MLIAQARVETTRSARYLVQLCRHVDRAARTHPQMQARVEWSDERGVIGMGQARCMLYADAGALILRAEAPDHESLRQLEHRVGDRLEQVGRRDRLTVAWTSPHGVGERRSLMNEPDQPLSTERSHADG